MLSRKIGKDEKRKHADKQTEKENHRTDISRFFFLPCTCVNDTSFYRIDKRIMQKKGVRGCHI